MRQSFFPLTGTPRFPGRYPTGKTPAPRTPAQTPKDKEQETPFLTQSGFTPTKHPKPKKPTFIEMATGAASGSTSSSATVKPDTQIQDSQDQTLEEALQQSAAASVKDEDGVSDTPKKGDNGPPGGDPDPNNDPRGGGGGPGRRPPPRPVTPPPFRSRRTKQPEPTIPKLKHILTGPENFTSWAKHLKLALIMYDLYEDDEDSPTYWELVDGYFEQWHPIFYEEYGIREKKWLRASAFTMLTIEKNCELEPHKLVRLCETPAEAFRKLKSHYENKLVADLGLSLRKITKMVFSETDLIEDHIKKFGENWDNMYSNATSGLKEEDKEFGKILSDLGECKRAKKEFLLSTFPDLMKYNQMVQNLRSQPNLTYGDIIANLKAYVPQLIWKKKKDYNGKGESGSKENPVVLATHQQNQQGQGRNNNGPPKDKFGNLLDTSKQCGYCQKVKKWRGIGHIESECKTKQRERGGQEKGGQVKAAYEESDDFEVQSQLGGVKIGRINIRMLRIGKIRRQNSGWYEFDTGAQAHTTNEKWRLSNTQPGRNITGFNGTTTTSECQGTMSMRHNGRDIILKNVQYHPRFCNLISGQKLPEFTLSCNKENGTQVLINKGDTLYQISKDLNGTMWIIPEDTKILTLKVNKETLQGLHERYGHISFDTLKTLPEAKGLPGTGTCTACLKGKSTNPPSKPSPVGPIRTTRVMERIHADLIRPLSKEWLGKKYILTILDDYSRYCTAIPIRDKTHASEKTKEWILALDNITEKTTTFIQTDWGTEFNNLKSWGTKRGTQTKETVPYHSETHATIERLNRTLQNMARTAMIAAGLKGLWGDAIQWAAYTKNRVPHRALNGKSPIEVLLNKKVNRDNLRPFGQKVMAHIYKEQRESRMSERAIECRIMQYTETHGIYLVVNHSGKRFLSKDPRPVIEQESSEDESENEPDNWKDPIFDIGEKLVDSFEPPAAPRKSRRIEENLELGKGISNYQDLINKGLTGQTNNRVGHDEDHPTEEQVTNAPVEIAQEWAKAREIERAKLRQYNVYTIVPREQTKGHRVVDTKWVYDVKRDAQGTLLRRRARKVGRGFTQEAGINYGETFSQMSRSETWRILLVLAVQNNWAIRQWDVKAAYLQALLTHEVYIQDTNEKGETEYWRLNKALYGLKQAGHEWYKTMKNIMQQIGLQQSIGDPGCFYKNELIISTHVDDMMAVAPTEQHLNDIEIAIEDHVELDKLGIPKKLLGMELTWTKGMVKLTQRTSIDNLAKEHGVTKMTKTLPLQINEYELEEKDLLTPEQQKIYQSLVGSLLYINRCTRPEISIHVNLLGRRTAKASPRNMTAAMHVLQYLLSSSDEGLTLKKQNPEKKGETKENQTLKIVGYADASYGGEESRSQKGTLVSMNGNAIMWNSRRQDTVSLSITEAEYIACSEIAKDLRWLQQVLQELLPHMNTSTSIMTDNEAALKLCKTQTFHRRTKHIEHRYHYLRMLVDQQVLKVKWINGKENPADIMTKLIPMTSLTKWKGQWRIG